MSTIALDLAGRLFEQSGRVTELFVGRTMDHEAMAELDREVRQVLDYPRMIRELHNLMNASMRRAPWFPVQLNDARQRFLQVLRDAQTGAEKGRHAATVLRGQSWETVPDAELIGVAEELTRLEEAIFSGWEEIDLEEVERKAELVRRGERPTVPLEEFRREFLRQR